MPSLSLALRGRVKITVRSAEIGELLEKREAGNIIVTVGKYQICDLMIGASTTSFNYCGVGSSDQTPSPSDTDLIQPIAPRKQVTDRFRTATTATFSTFFSSSENNGTWRECGLFTAQTSGVMLCRAVFNPPIVKDQSKTATVDWDIEVS
ncbi:MAG: hypothetical protein ACK4TI_00580 [Nitrososphaerales archaeon]